MRTLKLNPRLIMRDWSIGTKLSVGFGLIFLFTLALAATSLSNLVAMQQVINSALDEGLQIQAQGNRIENGLASARREEQAFLLSWQEIGYQAAVNDHVIPWGNQISDIQQAVSELNELTAAGSEESFVEISRNITELSAALDVYRAEFNQTINQFQDLGTSASGVIGNLETASQALEAELRTLERPDLVESFLQLRLSESEYQIAGRTQYQERVTQAVAQLRSDITDTVTTDNQQLLVLLDNYETAFAELVDLNDKIERHRTAYISAADSIQPLALEIGAQGATLADSSLGNVTQSVQRARTALAVAAVLAVALTAILSIYFTRQISRPLHALTDVAERVTAGDLTAYVAPSSKDEIGTLATAFNSMTQKLQASIGGLEQQVATRTQALQVSAEVSRSLSTILDQQQLVAEVVRKVRDTFDYYHAHIYLFDEAREYLVMVGGTGEAGRAMLANEHKLPVGKGLVGRAAVTKKPILVPDVTTDPGWLPNPLLPETQAEVAVPITFEGEVLGVLDVQNKVVGSLGTEDVNLLLSIVGQVAIGLKNASLFAQVADERRQIQKILDAISTPLIISKVSDGRIAYVNDAVSAAFLESRESLVGQVTPDFYVNPDDRTKLLALLREQGFANNFETVLQRTNGEQFWAIVSSQIINYQDEPSILSSVVDINDRVMAEAVQQKQANELATVAQVSTVAATILDPQDLLQQVADLTKSSFGLYHAHVHLLDENGQMLVLTAGAGEVGRQMVAEGRRIPLAAEGSLVASVARNVQGEIRIYESAEEGFMPHPLLADTRSEMAVPIAIGKQVLGVLDVRSDQPDHFNESDLQTVTTLASQVAVALQNARSYTRSEEAVQELQELSRRLTREGWDEFFEQQVEEEFSFGYDLEQVNPVADAKEAPAAEMEALLAQPLEVQGESIGELLLGDSKLNKDDAAEIVAAVAERLSVHLENLRLAEQTQLALTQAEKRGKEMATINNIVTQISTSLDLQHSLQIVVDELATAVNVDQVRVALLQPEKNELLIIAEYYDPARANSAVGLSIPIEGNELTQTVIDTRQTIVVEDAQNSPKTVPVHDMFREQGIETVVLIPLVVNDEVIGTLGMDILDKRPLPADGLKLAETVVYQTATAIQNARLFEQVQATLAETEMLYSYSSQLNAATSLEAVLDSAAAAGFQVGAADALLVVYDRNTTGNPEFAQIAAVAPHDEDRVGEILHLQEQPARYLWPVSGQNTVFVGDVQADERLSPEDKAAFAQQGVQALALMYLNVGNLRLGHVVIHWDKAQTFTHADERLYGAIAQQASSVVYNRLLFNQTEEALSETAALYQASADLNTAQTYDEVLAALRQHTILGQGAQGVTIYFFDRPWEKNDTPEEIRTLAQWSTATDLGPDKFKLTAFPDADQIFKRDELIVFEDITTDERFSEQSKQILLELFKAKSFVYVPILVAGQWMGFISGVYPHKVSFSEEQTRRLNVLVRQAAVTIQSIRLYEQTQEALAQTEALYTGSERIVLSSTEDDILQSLIESTELHRLERASLFMFDNPVEDRVARDVTVMATWVNEGVRPSVQVGTRFEVARVPFLAAVNPDESMVINDIRTDPRVDEQTRQILENYGMISFVMIPVVVGSQWLGMVSGQSSEPLFLTDVQMRQANSLVGQAAVVMQTTLLFRQEQARARREQLLREIATKVRSSTHVDSILRSAVVEIGQSLGRRTFVYLHDDLNDNGKTLEEVNGA